MFYKGDKVKGTYYNNTPFTGTINNKECVNNGSNPAYAYYIELDQPIDTGTFGPRTTICFVDRDMLKLGYELEVVGDVSR